jgi:hypothetical protein
MSEPMEASKAYIDGVKIGASVLLQDQRRRDLLAACVAPGVQLARA